MMMSSSHEETLRLTLGSLITTLKKGMNSEKQTDCMCSECAIYNSYCFSGVYFI